MAYVGTPKKCFVCEKMYSPISTSGGPMSGCPHCALTEADLKEKAHFAALDELTTEQRIRKIEKWIYHYKPPRNIRDIKF